jgi:hypothetical protein
LVPQSLLEGVGGVVGHVTTKKEKNVLLLEEEGHFYYVRSLFVGKET